MSEIHQSWIFTFFLHNRKCLGKIWHVLIHHWHKTYRIRLDIYTFWRVLELTHTHTHTHTHTQTQTNKNLLLQSNTKAEDVHDLHFIVWPNKWTSILLPVYFSIYCDEMMWYVKESHQIMVKFIVHSIAVYMKPIMY